jgi:hypothetical protein
MDYLAKKYAEEISEKIDNLRCAFHNKIDEHCDSYLAARDAENGNEYYAADRLARDESFIQKELIDEITELASALLSCDVCGTYIAGFVPVARTREEWQRKSDEKKESFYNDLSDAINLRKRVNAITTDFEGFMNEVLDENA